MSAVRCAVLGPYRFGSPIGINDGGVLDPKEIIMGPRPASRASVASVMATVVMIAAVFAVVGPTAGAGPEARPGEIDATFVPVQPCRLFDLRPDHGGDRTAPLGPGEVYVQQVTGAVGDCNLPADVTGVTMNVTIVRPTARSYLTIYPADLTTVPNVSNLNWIADQAPTPNAVNVKLSPDGKLKFFNNSGQVYVIADVVGYHTPTSLETLDAGIAQQVIPSGMTVTGNIVYSAQATTDPFFGEIGSDLPGTAPVPLDDADVNFGPGWIDSDDACTGTPDDPTAPPGKVCIYPSFTRNFGTYQELFGSAATVRTRGFRISMSLAGVSLEPSAESQVVLRGSWAYTAP
jgi:hypothetical protein